VRAEQGVDPLPGNVRRLREANNLSQVALAVAAGLSPATVARIEAGQKPRLETVEQLAGALKVDIWELLSAGAGGEAA
jgi:transcriptional regulator with XRE-family HTH domain